MLGPMDDDRTLLDAHPLPASVNGRLGEQLRFLVEIDRLKTVLRQSVLAADRRRENDAEHSWHLALMVLVLAEHADEPIDAGRAVELVLIHDLVEIHAGDVPYYDTAARAAKEQRERDAAQRLFALLPADQAARMHERWEEYEAQATPEARFAHAVDRLQPLLLNWVAADGRWNLPDVSDDLVRRLNGVIGSASQALGSAASAIIDEGARRNGGGSTRASRSRSPRPR